MTSENGGLRLRGGILSIFLILILFLIPTTYAVTSYETTSGENKTFFVGDTILSDDLANLITASHEVIDLKISDLNNDGTNEIIVLDGQSSASPAGDAWTIYVYHSASLTPVDSISFNMSQVVYSNLEIADLDDDGFKEIWYADGTEGLKTITLDAGNNLIYSNPITASVTGSQMSSYIISCDDDLNVCALATFADVANNGYLIMRGFNYTALGSPGVQIFTAGGSGQSYCISNIKEAPIGEFNPNNGNIIEVVYSYLKVDGVSEVCMVVGGVDKVTLVGSKIVESCYSVGSVWSDASPLCYTDGYYKYITPPFVKDINGFPSDGSEVVVGSVEDNVGEYSMVSWKITGTKIDEYPEDCCGASNAEGNIVSNIFEAQALNSNGYKDFCMLSYNNDADSDNEMLCGSEINTATFFWGLSTSTIKISQPDFPINLTPSLYHYPQIVFGTEHEDGNSLTEVSTSYGIYKINSDDEVLDVLYSMPFTNGMVIPVDPENVGKNDLLVGVGSTKLFYYINDAFSNRNCLDDGCVVTLFSNPCGFDGDLINNDTQMQVRVTATDQDGDLVNVRVNVFDDTVYEQNKTFYNQTGGSSLPFLFDINQTGNGWVLKVEVWDTPNPSKIKEYEYFFDTSSLGYEFGDLTCEESFVVDVTDVNGTLTSAEEDVVSGSVEALQDISGLSTVGIWYFVLLVISAFMIFGAVKSGVNIIGVLVGVVVFAFLWVLVGYLFGFLPLAHLLIEILLLILGVAIAISTMVLGNRGG